MERDVRHSSYPLLILLVADGRGPCGGLCCWRSVAWSGGGPRWGAALHVWRLRFVPCTRHSARAEPWLAASPNSGHEGGWTRAAGEPGPRGAAGPPAARGAATGRASLARKRSAAEHFHHRSITAAAPGAEPFLGRALVFVSVVEMSGSGTKAQEDRVRRVERWGAAAGVPVRGGGSLAEGAAGFWPGSATAFQPPLYGQSDRAVLSADARAERHSKKTQHGQRRAPARLLDPITHHNTTAKPAAGAPGGPMHIGSKQ
jgi:hypothetical protein